MSSNTVGIKAGLSLQYEDTPHGSMYSRSVGMKAGLSLQCEDTPHGSMYSRSVGMKTGLSLQCEDTHILNLNFIAFGAKCVDLLWISVGQLAEYWHFRVSYCRMTFLCEPL